MNGNFTWKYHICGHQLEGKQFKLQIKWLGLEEGTCEPLKNIATGVKDLVQKYLLFTDF